MDEGEPAAPFSSSSSSANSCQPSSRCGSPAIPWPAGIPGRASEASSRSHTGWNLLSGNTKRTLPLGPTPPLSSSSAPPVLALTLLFCAETCSPRYDICCVMMVSVALHSWPTVFSSLAKHSSAAAMYLSCEWGRTRLDVHRGETSAARFLY